MVTYKPTTKIQLKYLLYYFKDHIPYQKQNVLNAIYTNAMECKISCWDYFKKKILIVIVCLMMKDQLSLWVYATVNT